MYKYFWNEASEKIWEVLQKKFYVNERILEIGCSSGHFLAKMYAEGYKNLVGIDIRDDQISRTKEDFSKQGINVEIRNQDLFEVTDEFDGVFSTGLLQCFTEKERISVIEQIGKIAPKAVFVVPEIKILRNKDSNTPVGVASCTEYETGNIFWELSRVYPNVSSGLWDSEILGVEDNFIYYVCRK